MTSNVGRCNRFKKFNMGNGLSTLAPPTPQQMLLWTWFSGAAFVGLVVLTFSTMDDNITASLVIACFAVGVAIRWVFQRFQYIQPLYILITRVDGKLLIAYLHETFDPSQGYSITLDGKEFESPNHALVVCLGNGISYCRVKAPGTSLNMWIECEVRFHIFLRSWRVDTLVFNDGVMEHQLSYEEALDNYDVITGDTKINLKTIRGLQADLKAADERICELTLKAAQDRQTLMNHLASLGCLTLGYQGSMEYLGVQGKEALNLRGVMLAGGTSLHSVVTQLIAEAEELEITTLTGGFDFLLEVAKLASKICRNERGNPPTMSPEEVRDLLEFRSTVLSLRAMAER